MKDLRSPLAVSRDEWMQSIKGTRCAEGTAGGQYLRNRLEMAFIAGWNAAVNAKSLKIVRSAPVGGSE